MIPKISLYEFFDTYNGATGGYEEHTVVFNQIAQTTDYHTPKTYTPEQKKRFEIQKELFEIIARLEFTLYSYGYVNFFSYYKEYLNELPRLCELLKLYFGKEEFIEEPINGMQQGILFSKKNKEKLMILDDYDHPKYEETYEELESIIDFDFGLSEIMYEVYELFLENPDHYCLDENGNSINPEYSGEIITHCRHDGHKTVSTLKNGRFNGEVIIYFPGNEKIREIKYRSNNYLFDVKKWYENGNLKQETTNYLPNTDYARKPTPKNSKCWYESGAIAHEYTEEYKINWHENGQKIRESRNNIDKFWDLHGNEITQKEYFDKYYVSIY